MNNFDKHFDNTTKMVNRSILAVIGVWLIGTMVWLTIIGLLGWVAYHFISKYW